MEKMLSPTDQVLQLYYEMLIDQIDQIQALSAKGKTASIDGHTSLKKYIVSFIASIAFQEETINEEETVFIQNIIGEEVSLSLAQNSIKEKSIEEFIDYLCLETVLQKNGNKNTVVDLFNFSEEVGQTFLIRFGTPKQISFYNEFMKYVMEHILQKCPQLTGSLEFRELDVHFSYPAS